MCDGRSIGVSEPIESIADIRIATHEDADAILRMMVRFNVHESIDYSEERLAAGFAQLLAHPEWGAVLLAEVGGVPAGYAVVAYGFDFEYRSRPSSQRCSAGVGCGISQSDPLTRSTSSMLVTPWETRL